ncbi:MAG: branched-chain amino acid ABC transporter permease [Chitinivibrionales bacterium]
MSSYLFQQLLNGIQLGTIYALIALGYTMVYGIIKLINFAHADIFMVGAYVAFFLVAYLSGTSGSVPVQLCIWPSVVLGYLVLGFAAERIPFVKSFFGSFDRRRQNAPTIQSRAAISFAKSVAQMLLIMLLAAVFAPVLYFFTRTFFKPPLNLFSIPAIIVYVMVICALLGMAMEKTAYRPLRHKPRISALITAMGVSFFLENFCSLPIVFGNKYQAFPTLVQKHDVIRFAGSGVAISNIFIINMSVLACMLFLLWFIVEKTLIGKQMRAVAFDHTTASLMGIDVDKTISITFMIGPALAGVSGILYAMNYGILQSPFLGFYPGLKAFIAAVLGGIGSLPGAVLGAFLMGTTEVFANSIDSNLGFAAAFVVLIVILLIKPTGILGKKEIDKV